MAPKPCRTCGHYKSYHEGDIDHPTCCRVWPMPGAWSECPCREYIPPGSSSERVDAAARSLIATWADRLATEEAKA